MTRVRQFFWWILPLLRFCLRVARAFLHNRGILLAGGVGYNSLLSLVPFLTLAVALLSLFFDQEQILGVLRPELKVLVPQSENAILEAADAFLQNKAANSIISILLLLFFSSIAFRMLEQALAAIFHRHVQGASRSFWVSALLPYVFLGLLVIMLFLLTLVVTALGAVGDREVHFLGVRISVASGMTASLHAVAFLGLVALFTAIYRVLPVVRISMRRALVGGIAAAVLWRLVGAFMVYYFTNLSMVNLVYGSLATVIVVLLFMEVAFIILLLGAQVIAELEATESAGRRWFEPLDAGPVLQP